jgi:Tol biopolymer transport system component
MKRSILHLGMIFTSLVIILSSCSTTYMTQSSGESFEQLTKITDIGKPCIGPNGGDGGTNLFFSVIEDDGYIHIYRKEKVTLPAITQKTFGNGLFLWPSYNSINEKIVFQNLESNDFDIFSINAVSKGKAITSITSTDGNEYNPSWSPDGNKIIFEKGAPPRQYVKTNKGSYKTTTYSAIKVTSNQIWIKDLETGELKMIGQGSYPKYSPDGKYIAFVKYELNKSKTSETGTLWIMSSDGETKTQLTNATIGYATRPNWSPDSKSLIFQLTKKDKRDSDLYSIEISGESLKQYTNNKSNDFSPYWTSDGFVYFSSDRGSKKGKYQIWRFKIN